MKIFGHPLHIMLIHFPSALFPMELVCYFLYYYTGQASFAMAAYYALWGAVCMGWLTGIFGAIDLTVIPSEKTEILKKALIHGTINLTVVIVYSVFLYILFKKYPAMPLVSMGLLIGKFCSVSFMIVGNYIGGSLILHDKIGVKE